MGSGVCLLGFIQVLVLIALEVLQLTTCLTGLLLNTSVLIVYCKAKVRFKAILLHGILLLAPLLRWLLLKVLRVKLLSSHTHRLLLPGWRLISIVSNLFYFLNFFLRVLIT